MVLVVVVVAVVVVEVVIIIVEEVVVIIVDKLKHAASICGCQWRKPPKSFNTQR